MFFKKNENQNPQGEEENNSTEVVTVAEVTGKAENETVDTIEEKPEERTTGKVEEKPEFVICGVNTDVWGGYFRINRVLATCGGMHRTTRHLYTNNYMNR